MQLRKWEYSRIPQKPANLLELVLTFLKNRENVRYVTSNLRFRFANKKGGEKHFKDIKVLIAR